MYSNSWLMNSLNVSLDTMFIQLEDSTNSKVDKVY